MDMPTFSFQMLKYFRIKNANLYIDPLLSLLKGSPVIDVIRFDKYLEKQFPDEMNQDDISSADIVEKYFGKDAKKFIINNI